MPRSKNFHGLKRLGGGKVRQTWNKINLYNLARWSNSSGRHANTFFQQKWKAKSTTRAYHGEHILENHWKRMFRSRFRSVIPMSHLELASSDGSKYAAGRGSGRDQMPPTGRVRKTKSWRIPYMQMTYAPMERRLDTAIFRALFASSARQARQFVVHGKVKVNGKKMPYPGYMLNPGDMFQVEPESVLFATGAPKESEAIRAGQKLQKVKQHETRIAAEREAAREARRKKAIEAAEAKKSQEEAEDQAGQEASQRVEENTDEVPDDKQLRKQQRTRVQSLIETAKVLIRDTKNPPSGKRKVELRSFIKGARDQMNKSQRKALDVVDKEIEDLTTSFAALTPTLSEEEAAVEEEQKRAGKEKAKREQAYKTAYEQSLATIMEARFAATDDSKPYATPWKPRPYMAAFAFIPAYLEVNQNICSAVYLRHPVAKPGASEVPTPFGESVHQLAFNWYLRNGR